MTTFASEVASPPVPDWYHPALDNILTMQFDDGTTVTNCLTGLTGETFDVANQIGTTAPNGERLSMTWSVAPSQELLDSVNADPFSTLETEQERLDNYHLVIPYPRSTEELIITPTTNVSKDFVIEFKLKYETIASGNPSILVAGSSTSSQYHIYLNNTSITLGYQWQITKFTLANTLPITKSDAPVTIRLVLKDGNLSAYQDGVQLALLSGSETGITKGFLIEDTQLFTRNNEGLSLFYFTYASNDFPADSRYWNFDKTFGAVINDEFNNQPLTLVGFPAASGSVRDDTGEIVGYRLATGSQTITFPFIGSYDVNLTDELDVVTNYTGSGSLVINGSTPITITALSGNDSGGNVNYDFTTGDNSRIIETIQGKHATVVNAETSGFMPIIEKYVFTDADYSSLVNLNTAESGRTNGAVEYWQESALAGTTLTGFVEGLILKGVNPLAEITTPLTLTTTGYTEINNLICDDIIATGMTGKGYIINSEVQDVTA